MLDSFPLRKVPGSAAASVPAAAVLATVIPVLEDVVQALEEAIEEDQAGIRDCIEALEAANSMEVRS